MSDRAIRFRFTMTGDRTRPAVIAVELPDERLPQWWRRPFIRIKSWWIRRSLLRKLNEGVFGDNPDDPRRDFTDLIARVALAIERGGDDHLGDRSSIQRDLIRILTLVPKNMMTLRIHDIDQLTFEGRS